LALDPDAIERELLLGRCVETLRAQPGYYAFLVGAGISTGAGIPMGGGVVALLRQKLLEELQRDLSPEAGDRLFRELGWFQDADTEYSEALLRAFASDAERQRFFRGLISGKMPTLAHYYLASIIASGRCSLILTTNFDDLLEKALYGLRFDQFNVVTHGEGTEYVSSQSGMATIVKLHGHYTYPQLANLSNDLQQLSGKLGAYFESLLRDFGLIVCGYAGRDRSVMHPITDAVRRRTVARGVIWCLRNEAQIAGTPYLNALKRHGQGNVRFLTIKGADDFYRDLHNRLGLPETQVLDAVSTERFNYQRRKMLERLSTGMSLDLHEGTIDRDLYYQRIDRHDEIDMVTSGFMSRRRLWVRNMGNSDVLTIRHAEYGENKISHDDLRLEGRRIADSSPLEFRPIGDPDLSFCRAFEIVLPAPLAPGADTAVEYVLAWPGEPAAYGQQPHSQSISLVRYQRGVGHLDFSVSVKDLRSSPISRAWVLGLGEGYKEHAIVESSQIRSANGASEFSFSVDAPADCLYVLYYVLGGGAGESDVAAASPLVNTEAAAR
jgi:hypothetical protein